MPWIGTFKRKNLHRVMYFKVLEAGENPNSYYEVLLVGDSEKAYQDPVISRNFPVSEKQKVCEPLLAEIWELYLEEIGWERSSK